jgi:hypothetical protein
LDHKLDNGEPGGRILECAREWEPMSRQFECSWMTDYYAKPDFTSQLVSSLDAESLLWDVKPDGSRPDSAIAPLNPESN